MEDIGVTLDKEKLESQWLEGYCRNTTFFRIEWHLHEGGPLIEKVL